MNKHGCAIGPERWMGRIWCALLCSRGPMMVGSPEECCKLRVCIEMNRSIPYKGVFRWKSDGAPFGVPFVHPSTKTLDPPWSEIHLLSTMLRDIVRQAFTTPTICVRQAFT